MSILDYEGQAVTLPLMDEPITIGKVNTRISLNDMKVLITSLDLDFNLLRDLLPIPSLKSPDEVGTLNFKGVTDVCLELITKRGVNPFKGNWEGLSDYEYFIYWRFGEWLSKLGYGTLTLNKPKLHADGFIRLPHFKVKYHCPFGCVNYMSINQRVESNEIKSQLYILWIYNHLKNFHKVDLNLLDSFLTLDIMPDIFDIIPQNKGERTITPKIVYMDESHCPKCKGIHNAILSDKIVLCQNVECNHHGNPSEFKP